MKPDDLTPSQQWVVRKISERFVNFSILSVGVILVLAGAFIKNTQAQTVLFGVGGSLIASSVVSYLTSLYIYKRQKEKEVTETWGVLAIYKSRAEMNSSCDLSVQRCRKEIDMIGFGFRSFRDSKNKEIEEKVGNGLKIRILTMHPDSDLLKQREKDERVTEGSIRGTIVQLADWVEKLQDLAPDKANVQIRFYDAGTLDFYFKTDDRLYTGPYLYGKQSQQTISYEFSVSGLGCAYFTDYFEYLWDKSTDSVPKEEYAPD